MASSLNVYELRLKVYLLSEIAQEQSSAALGEFFDSHLAKNPTYLKLHQTNCFKFYCFDRFYPTEADGIYRKDQIYTVRIRTVSPTLAQYFSDSLANHYTARIKGLTLQLRQVPQKMISELYSVTPAVIKCTAGTEAGKKVSGGYWKDCISFDEYEQRLKVNLIKKYNVLTGTKLDESFDLYRQIELVNRKPIAVPYKRIRLLGDKLRLQISENEQAQQLAYLAVGTGICELNARGLGFVNYQFL